MGPAQRQWASSGPRCVFRSCCIDAYTTESLETGADLEQMTEAVHVATAIRGGASLVHGIQMLEQTRKAGM